MLNRLLNKEETCPVTAALLEEVSRHMSASEHGTLRELPPKADRKATARRTMFLNERSVRKYAAESLQAAGRVCGARIISDEPDLRRAANLAKEMSGVIYGTAVKRGFQTTLRDRYSIAAYACLNAGATAGCDEEGSGGTEEAVKMARTTGVALNQWAKATGNSVAEEVNKVLEQLSGIR